MSERTLPRAPASDGAVVAEPPLSEAGAVLAANRQHLRAFADRHALLGRPWSELRRQARQNALAAVERYLGADTPARGDASTVGAWLVAGHQPELFHPGVWIKNFALCGLAAAHGATALNLVIDNDTVKSTALHVPAKKGTEAVGEETVSEIPFVYRRSVLFDRWTGETPYEERPIADRALFDSFADRAGEPLRDWSYQPMLPAFWAEVRRQAERTPNLGECFTAARRTFERAWGCHNREVPLSALCGTEPFAWFACALLADLPRFHTHYNAILADYRRRHGLRSHHHPVPDLAAEGEWLEAPFWAWQAAGERTRRGRLFARLHADRLELRAGAERWPDLPRPEAGRAESAVTAWQTLQRQGFKVRSRALTTTLYARLFLADLFIHGIGGGKYDELTDELMRRFYGCAPPVYLILSGTRWLPLPRAAVTPDDRRRLHRQLRDVIYNPQRHFEKASPDLAELAARKQEWIERRPTTPAGRRARFQALRTLTEQLHRPLQQRQEQLRRDLAIRTRQLRANAVMQRRDYSFCLYPTDILRPFCTQFLGA